MTVVDHPDGTVAPEPPAASDRSLWHNQDFLKFWSGEALSLFGSQITNLALPLTAVIYFNATAQQVGLLRFLQWAPYLFLAMLFGVWVDRYRRKPIMLLANSVRLVAIAMVPLLAFYDLLPIGGLMVIACVVGIFSVLFEVSWLSFVPTLVKHPTRFVEANQKMGVTQSTADVAGPGAAGVLIGWLGPPTALVVDALSYLASLAMLLWIRTPEPAPPRAAQRHVGRELLEGVRWVFGHRLLRPLALLAPFTNFSLTCVSTLFLLYAVRDKGLNAATVGLILSVSAVGALVGALVSRAIIRLFPVGLVYGVALAAIYTTPLLIPLADGPRPVVVGLFMLSLLLGYLGSGLSNVVQLTIRQTSTPTALMGRMNAAFRTLLFGGAALGGLVAGLIGGAMSLRAALTVVAVGSAAMVVPLALSSVVRLRTMPEPVGDPAPAGTD
ncbi:MFS transporter [Micromonospora sp. WMMA1923]|uniref:MFS transporter n=1 Tax=Micromonospora sp. WMMA1923 TaxID=3404125 RepID=UPI003B9381DC